jgi:hypothetical protein
MKLICIHCGRSFAIRAEQLGTKGTCPHCKGEISLPKASDQLPHEKAHRDPWAWFDYSVSSLTSMMVHMALFLLLVYLQGDGSNTAGPGEEIQIGMFPIQELADTPAGELQAETVAQSTTQSPSALEETLEAESPVLTSSDTSAEETEQALAAPSIGGGDPAGFDLGGVGGAGAGGGMAGGGSFDSMVKSLRRNGLDVVIAFDSTGSMSGEINEVKSQIHKIGTTMLALVPKTRFSLCTYRDQGDSYVTKGIPLTSDIRQLEYFLKGIEAGGGGDHPEAVQEGIKWAIDNNKFRPSARKIILVFGDAPPHADDQPTCLKLARNFHGQDKGIVSTVTCRANAPMPEFYAIAVAGGGEAFLATDSRQIVSQLVILVFGSQHKDKVVEAFKLLEK